MNKFELMEAIALSDLGRNEALILDLFVRKADETYKCFPSVATITKMTNICVTSYKKAINRLIEMGLVKRQFRFSQINGQQRSNYFYISKQLFIGSKDNIVTMINNAISELKAKMMKKQLELPLTADTNPASTNNNDEYAKDCAAPVVVTVKENINSQNDENKQFNGQENGNTQKINSNRSQRAFWSKKRTRFIPLFARKFNFNNIRTHHSQNSNNCFHGYTFSFLKLFREGSHFDPINYSFYSIKKKKYLYLLNMIRR